MGSICSFLSMEGLEEFNRSDASIYRSCVCLSCLSQRFIHMYKALIQGEMCPIPLTVQGTASSESSTRSTDSSICDTYRSPPRPLAFDDPRFSRPQHDNLIFRRDKSSSHFHEETELLRSNNDTNIESISVADKLHGSNYEGGSKLFYSMCIPRNSSKELTAGLPYTSTSSEDEDVCPTCLEDYTSENPRIVMKCSHHFHLGCIYEWKERSESCPVCGKLMVFNETE